MTVAMDGFIPNIQASHHPAIHHDLTQGPLRTVVDWTHCQEVVEHIEEQYLDFLLATLMCGKLILMSHAAPGQGGHHHVNLQPREYWVSHLEARGCLWLEEDTNRVRAIAASEGALYLANTGLLFVNKARYAG